MAQCSSFIGKTDIKINLYIFSKFLHGLFSAIFTYVFLLFNKSYLVPTFFIKFVMACIMGLFVEKFLSNVKFNWVIGACVGGLFQIIAYTVVKIPLFGMAYAIAGIYGLTLQTISGVIISILLISVLAKAKVINKLREV